MRSLKYLWIMALALLVAACGHDSTGPSTNGKPVTFLVNGDTTLVTVDSSAGGQIPITFKIIEVLGDSPIPMEVRFSATNSAVSVAVDTTDANFEVHTVWLLGSQVGEQDFLAEFYRLSDGHRITGNGYALQIHAGKVAVVPLRSDSLVLFVGEHYPLLQRVTGAITDSFGNPRSLGAYTVAPIAGSWTVAHDTVTALAPTITGLVLAADLARDTVNVRADERYLDVHPYSFSYGCNDHPPVTRGTDNAVVGFNLLSTGSVVTAYPGDTLYQGTFGGAMQLVLTEHRQFTYTDSVVTTSDIQSRIAVQSWRPDSIVYFNGTVGHRSGTTLTGGNWCSNTYPAAATPVAAVLHQ